MSAIIPVILCGGSGTRLWPVSRRDRPKQFASLVGNETLLDATLRRAGVIAGSGEIICVTAAEYGAAVRHSIDRLGLRGRLLLEPEPRNTAPALAVAALAAMRIDPAAILVALPADHFIEEGDGFATSVARACTAAAGDWLTVLGVAPRHPAAAFGYIVPGAAIEGLPGVARVSHFIEKPPPELARRLIDEAALWNAGIVVARAALIIEAVREHEPSILAAVERSLGAGESDEDGLRLERGSFGGAPKLSFDNAVLERHGRVAVTPLDAPWRDVGTWEEVAELFPADAGGNRRRGRVHFTASRNSFVFSPHRLTVGIGLSDVVVVDTPDALLVASRDDLGRLRGVVEALAAERYPEVSADTLGLAAAGAGGVRSSGGSFLATELSLAPGETLRREPRPGVACHWIVLEGGVSVSFAGGATTYGECQSFYVPPGIALQLASCGGLPARLIEVRVTPGARR